MDLEKFKELCGNYASNKMINFNHRQASDLDKMFDCAIEANIAKKLQRKQAMLVIRSYFTGYNTGKKAEF